MSHKLSGKHFSMWKLLKTYVIPGETKKNKKI